MCAHNPYGKLWCWGDVKGNTELAFNEQGVQSASVPKEGADEHEHDMMSDTATATDTSSTSTSTDNINKYKQSISTVAGVSCGYEFTCAAKTDG